MSKQVWLLAALLTCAIGCGGSVDSSLTERFQSAQAQFDQAREPAEFLRVAAIYQEILDAGIVSGAIFYNQGNAFMRAGERGRAIACYRQAKRYRPRDPFLDANLRYALSGIESTSTKPWIEHLIFWSDWISYHGKFQLGMVCALVTFGMGLTVVFVRLPWGKTVAVVMLAITLAVMSSAGYDWYRFAYLRHGVVVEDAVVARKGDSESYQPAFTQPLAQGTEFLVVEQRSGWTLIRLGPNQEGWLPNPRIVVY